MPGFDYLFLGVLPAGSAESISEQVEIRKYLRIAVSRSVLIRIEHYDMSYYELLLAYCDDAHSLAYC